MRAIVFGFAMLLGTSAAVADIIPEPDHGPVRATVAGLEFALRSVEVTMPPGYTKTFEVAVLTGCVENHPNCKLAHARDLIGMEVNTVDGESLQPEIGQLTQIADAFAHAKGPVKLELYRRGGDAQTVEVAFARR